MELKVKIMLGIALLGAILSFIPSNDGILLLLKLIVFIALLAIIYFYNVLSQMDKKFQIIINDVREDRRNPYRESLLSTLKSFGEIFTLQENMDEVGVGVNSKSAIEKVKKSIDGCKLKIQHRSTTCILRYSSLEASAQMTVGISGYATSGSEVYVEGIRDKIKVGNDGGFFVQVPMSLYEKYKSQGFIPAKCKKGSLEENIKIKLPK